MRQIRSLAYAFVLAISFGGSALAQDPSRIVRLQLEYNPNVRPNVLVPRLTFPGGDSVRSILQRDLANGDRIDVMPNTDSIVIAVAGPDYAHFQQLGATFIAQVESMASGIRVTLHEVGAKRVAVTKDFVLAGIANSYDWRWSVHGVSDDLQQWMTTERGIAQTRIAFARDGNLMVIDADGFNERVVERQERMMSPAWHPTQQTLAFSALVGSAWRIGTKPLFGGTTRWLTNEREGSNMSPVFSAKGTEVFYARQDNLGNGDAFNVTVATGLVRRLTQTTARITSLAMSPDGQNLLFVNDAAQNPSLYVMGTDGSNPRRFVALPPTGSHTYLETPSWAPSGDKIAYQARRGSDKAYQIEVMDVRSKTPDLLTSQGENEDPSWAPDSRHLVLVSNRGGSSQLWILDTKSGKPRMLTRGGTSQVKTPAWSPRVPEP